MNEGEYFSKWRVFFRLVDYGGEVFVISFGDEEEDEEDGVEWDDDE